MAPSTGARQYFFIPALSPTAGNTVRQSTAIGVPRRYILSQSPMAVVQHLLIVPDDNTFNAPSAAAPGTTKGGKTGENKVHHIPFRTRCHFDVCSER